MKNFSIFIIGALLVSLQITYAANCYGGQITSTTVAGGYYYDSYSDLTHSNNDLYAVGSTGSYDFPYDQSYFLWTSPAPEDAIISLAGEKITTGGGGYEYGTSIYVDGDILCVSGNTDYPSWFPTYAYDNDWSTEGNYRDSFFVIFNRTSSERLLSQTWGDAYDNQQSLISCNQKHNLIVLASDSAPNYPARKRDYNSNDVRISVFELVSGYCFYDGYFGSIDADDVPVAVDVHERSGKLYILVAGTTYAQGNDSFPIYNAYQNMSAGIRSGFVWLLNPDNVTNAELSFYFSTFFGGYAYTDIGDAAFDESGNIYVVGTAAENLPMKNAFDSQLCDQNVEGGSCAFLAVFNLQGNLLFSSYLGLNWTNVYGVSIQRLSDGGHLVYITGQTSNLQNFPSVERFDRTLNESENYSDDAFITIVYVAPDFSRGEIRLNTLYGSTGYDFASGITFLPNNSFAIAGGTDGSDLQGAGNYTAQYGDTVITTFQCGSGLYGLNPSPTPAASLPPPSPPPATCESQGGCYQAPGVYVQFEEGDNGELIPSQTVYPSQNNQIVQEYFLNVKYLSLEERNANGDLVVTVPFPSSGYGITSEDTVSNGVNVQVVTFSTYLFNGAEVDVINYFFEEAGTLDFAGTTIAVEDSTSKVSLRISGWNFEDTSNTLTLTILLNIAPQPKGPATQAPSGNQTQFSWDTGATDCRVTTLSTIEIDNGVGTSTFKATSANLTVTFPYFEYYVLYDPGYAVLVKDDQKSSPKEEISPWAYVGAALGALVVVSAIVGIGYFVVSKQKRKTEKALSYRPKDVEMS